MGRRSPFKEGWVSLYWRNAARWATTAAAVEAAATSLILLLSPALFGRLILGAELSEPGEAVGRLAGIALLGFALTSWPDPFVPSVTRAMLAYNLLATLYLSYLGIEGTSVGLLLWPAVALHLLLTALLGIANRGDRFRSITAVSHGGSDANAP
jgi:hypothetical protein